MKPRLATLKPRLQALAPSPLPKQIDKRIRGRRLQAIRMRRLYANPICEVCNKRIATQIDHKRALALGGTDTEDNRQNICDECHDTKTRREFGQKNRGGEGPNIF